MNVRFPVPVGTVQIATAFSNALRTHLASSLSPFSVEEILMTQTNLVQLHAQPASQTPVQTGSLAMPTQLVILSCRTPYLPQMYPCQTQLLDLLICQHRNPQIYQPSSQLNSRQICQLRSQRRNRPTYRPRNQLGSLLMSRHRRPLGILPNLPQSNQHGNQHHRRLSSPPNSPPNFQPNFQPQILLNIQLICLPNILPNTQQNSRPISLPNTQQNSQPIYLPNHQLSPSRLMCRKILFTVV